MSARPTPRSPTVAPPPGAIAPSPKAREPTYERIMRLVAEEHGVVLPNAAEVLRIERALVRDLVRAQGRPVS